MTRIKTISYPDSEGRLREIYDDLIAKRGKLANVHTIQSLRPESIVHHMDLYLEIMFLRSELSRDEREMMAVVVSVANGCEYCQKHHAEALHHYWKDQHALDALVADTEFSTLNERKRILCRFARQLTLQPESFDKHDMTYEIREAGLTDAGILDATLVISYFNFVNRIVLALDVESTQSEVTGYRF